MANDKKKKSRSKSRVQGTGLQPFGWNPFEPLFDDSFVRSMFGSPINRLTSSVLAREGFRVPRVDLVDNGDSFTINADMPGISKDKIKLNVTSEMVSIRATKEEARETKGKNFYSRERSSVGYFRNIAMPEDINPDTAKARYENGTLSIDVKKSKPSRPAKEISVE